MVILAWFVIFFQLFGMAAILYSIDKPREPITENTAYASVAFGIITISVIVWGMFM